MANDSKPVTMTTPAGKALYPRLVEPDYKFDADGLYSTNLVLSPEKAQPLIDAIDAALEKAVPEAKEKNPKAAKLIKAAPPPHSEDEDGNIVFKFKLAATRENKDGTKTNRSVKLFDARLKPITKKIKLGSGSTIKVSFIIGCNYIASQRAVFATLYIVAVQVIKLVEWGGGDGASFGFTAEESEDGFDADSFDGAAAEGEEADEDEAEDESDDDGDWDF